MDFVSKSSNEIIFQNPKKNLTAVVYAIHATVAYAYS